MKSVGVLGAERMKDQSLTIYAPRSKGYCQGLIGIFVKNLKNTFDRRKMYIKGSSLKEEKEIEWAFNSSFVNKIYYLTGFITTKDFFKDSALLPHQNYNFLFHKKALKHKMGQHQNITRKQR